MNEIPDPVVATASEYFRQGMLDEAGVLCEGLLAKAPRHYPAILLLSFIRARSGQLDEAVRLMKKAVKLKPRDADTQFRLGNLLIGQGSRGEAIISYDKALALNPGLVEAHVNRSNVLRELGRFDEAVAGYDRALAFDSRHALARSNRFVCLMGRLNDIDVALAEGIAVAQANLHASRAEACATGSNNSISAFRLKHDLEQCAYLLAAGLEFDGLGESHSALASLYAKHLAGRPFDGNQRLDLLTNEADSVEIFRRSLYLYRQPVAVDNCLNEDNDWTAIEQRYFSSKPEIIHIDNFLSRQALAAFRQFCLASTVWTAEYGNLYLGAFFDRGFISLLHLKLARELQARMPRIFGGHTLEDCWAFKYDSSMRKGTGVHADFAKVNLNFWITPDEANLDPATGGLLVYDVPAPKSWAPATYNGDTARIYGFLAEQRAKTVAVPYRCNRAVLFNSALFHETDSFQFKEGYENRRVNLTYLFGGGLNRDSQWV